MHEISIINSIVRTLEVTFKPAKLEKMTAIYLKIGPLSNIEPQLLHNAYEAYYQHDQRYQRVCLHIESTPLQIRCQSCDHITNVKNYHFICEKCYTPSKQIIQGEEMLIHKVEFEN